MASVQLMTAQIISRKTNPFQLNIEKRVLIYLKTTVAGQNDSVCPRLLGHLWMVPVTGAAGASAVVVKPLTCGQ